MRDPGGAGKKRATKTAHKLMAGSSDVTNSPAGRASKWMNGAIDSHPGKVRDNAPLPGSKPLSDDQKKALVQYLNIHHPDINVGAYGGIDGVISKFPDVQRFLGSKTTKQHVQGKPAIGNGVKPGKPDVIDRIVGRGKDFFTGVDPAKTVTPPVVKKKSGGGGANPPYQHSPGAGDGKTKQTKPAADDPLAPFAAWGRGVGQLIDPSMADTLANAKYAGTIADLENQKGKLPGQINQNKADINNWLGQVLSTLKTTTDRTKAAYSAAGDASTGAAKNILASLGGGDDPGLAHNMGNAGANGAALMQALGANADTFSQDMNPLIKLQQATFLNQQNAAGTQGQLDLSAKLAGAKGDRDALAAQTGMDILGQNNQLRQQRFQNAFGVAQQEQSAATAQGQNALNNLYKQWQIASLKKKVLFGNDGGDKTAFANTAASSRNKVAQDIVNYFIGSGSNPGYFQQHAGDVHNGQYQIAPILQMINGMIGNAGWNTGEQGIPAWRNSILQTLHIDPSSQSWMPGFGGK